MGLSRSGRNSLPNTSTPPITRVYALLTFYADFRTEPRGHHHMLICHGMACYVAARRRLVQEMQDKFAIADGDTTADHSMSIQVVNGCLGVCDLAPVVKMDDDYVGNVTPGSPHRPGQPGD